MGGDVKRDSVNAEHMLHIAVEFFLAAERSWLDMSFATYTEHRLQHVSSILYIQAVEYILKLLILLDDVGTNVKTHNTLRLMSALTNMRRQSIRSNFPGGGASFAFAIKTFRKCDAFKSDEDRTWDHYRNADDKFWNEQIDIGVRLRYIYEKGKQIDRSKKGEQIGWSDGATRSLFIAARRSLVDTHPDLISPVERKLGGLVFDPNWVEIDGFSKNSVKSKEEIEEDEAMFRRIVNSKPPFYEEDE